MTQRTQITLDSEQHRRARQRAAELGVSLAEYVRELVRRDLGDESSKADVSAIIGLGDSGGSDIARNKDEYIGDALDALHPRR
jgi:plasmid stability protein